MTKKLLIKIRMCHEGHFGGAGHRNLDNFRQGKANGRCWGCHNSTLTSRKVFVLFEFELVL